MGLSKHEIFGSIIGFDTHRLRHLKRIVEKERNLSSILDFFQESISDTIELIPLTNGPN